MRYILYCNLPYSFAILKPLEEEIVSRGFEYIWYIPSSLEKSFPYKESHFTTSIKDLKEYKADAIFVSGNDVPFFLQGIKVQIFHGLAGEKKGHFRIRDYFDLYLTQGPYFTQKFQELSLKHKNFEVIETGWCKLDQLFTFKETTKEYKKKLLQNYGVSNIILYAPTFSPSLTSAKKLLPFMEKIATTESLVIIKFHDKMDKEIVEEYKKLTIKNLIISDIKDITKLLQISDVMISDTSSVVYEFLLLDKPVITLNSISENINWLNIIDETKILDALTQTFQEDNFKEERKKIIQLYHPYTDGKSSERMIEATLRYKERSGVPFRRKISLFRKLKTYKNVGII